MSAISSPALQANTNNPPLQEAAAPAALYVPAILNNATSLLRTPAQLAEEEAKRDYEALQAERRIGTTQVNPAPTVPAPPSQIPTVGDFLRAHRAAMQISPRARTIMPAERPTLAEVMAKIRSPEETISGHKGAKTRAQIIQAHRENSTSNGLFFKCHTLQIKALLSLHTSLCPDAVRIVADYVLSAENPFGAKEWERDFGVSVGPEPELPENFYTFWHGPDPLDPTKQVCDTHFLPVLRPRFVTHIATHTSYFYGPKVLRQIMQEDPQKGNRSQLEYCSEFFCRKIEQTKAGASCWLVMRKDVLARKQSYAQQIQFIVDLNARTNAGYEKGASIIDLVTAAVARVAVGRDAQGHFEFREMEGIDSHSQETHSFEKGYQVAMERVCIGRFGIVLTYGKHDNSTLGIGMAALRMF